MSCILYSFYQAVSAAFSALCLHAEGVGTEAWLEQGTCRQSGLRARARTRAGGRAGISFGSGRRGLGCALALGIASSFPGAFPAQRVCVPLSQGTERFPACVLHAPRSQQQVAGDCVATITFHVFMSRLAAPLENSTRPPVARFLPAQGRNRSAEGKGTRHPDFRTRVGVPLTVTPGAGRSQSLKSRSRLLFRPVQETRVFCQTEE